MEPLKAPSVGGKASTTALDSTVSLSLSPLVSFAKQKQGELAFGSPVANKSSNPILVPRSDGAAGDATLATSNGEKKLSGLASFAKSQQQMQMQMKMQESLKAAPRDSNATNSHSADLGSNASLSRDSPLASFAKSIASATVSGGKPDSSTAQPSSAAAAFAIGARSALKRLDSASKPAPLLKGSSLKPLANSNAKGLEVDTRGSVMTKSEAKPSGLEGIVRDYRHVGIGEEKQAHGSGEAKVSSAVVAAEDSDSFSDMDEANIVRSDDEDEDDEEADTAKGAPGGQCGGKEAKQEDAKGGNLDAQVAEAELYPSSSQSKPPTSVRERRNLKPRGLLQGVLSYLNNLLTLMLCSARHRLLPKVFVPKASEIPLFHAVLVLDEELLEELLEQISPDEILGVRDHDERSLYHYAALSTKRAIKARVFSHANYYYDSDLGLKTHELMAKTQQMRAWMATEQTKSKTWIPPRVKELQRQSHRAKQSALLQTCECADRNGRSIFHYAATSKSTLAIENDPQWRSVIQNSLQIFARKDTFGKTPLHYAVEHGNSLQLQWFFQLGAGIHLNVKLIEELLHLSASKSIRDLLLREAKMLDAVNYRIQSEHDNCSGKDHDENEATVKDAEELGGSAELGISVFLAAKLERDVLSLSGPLLQSPLLKAVMFGNYSAVKLLLAKGANASARDANGWTVLHYCASGASRNHLAVAQFLLQEASKQVRINARSAKGRTALHVTANNSSIGKSISGADPTEIRAIKEQSDAKRAQMAALLWEHKADLDLQDTAGKTALLLAARSNNVSVAEFLLEKSCNPVLFDNTGSSPLHAAASQGHVQMTSFLARWDAVHRFWTDTDDNQGRKPIDVANNEQTRHALTVRDAAAELGVVSGNLWSASYVGEIESVKRLIQRSRTHRAKKERSRCDYTQPISVHDRTYTTQRSALHLAIQGYADTLNNSSTPLIEPDRNTPAAKAKAKQRQAKLDTSKRDAPNRFLQVAQLLVKAGAAELSISFLAPSLCFLGRITTTTTTNLAKPFRTLTTFAVHAGDKWGLTPLMLAATIKDEFFMEMLLEAIGDGREEEQKCPDETDTAKQDCEGNTTLHYAYAFGLAQVSNLLEERMDDTEVPNSQGKTPFEVTGYRIKLFPQGLRDHSAQHQRWRNQLNR